MAANEKAMMALNDAKLNRNSEKMNVEYYFHLIID